MESWKSVLVRPKVARLTETELDQPGQPMLHHLAAPAVLRERVALLYGTGLLQERFLRMQAHRPALARSRRDTL